MPLAPLAGILQELDRELGDGAAAELAGPEVAVFLPGRSTGSPALNSAAQSSMFGALRALLDRLTDEGPLAQIELGPLADSDVLALLAAGRLAPARHGCRVGAPHLLGAAVGG